MRKKWIVIIVICVLLLAVAGLTFYRGSKMDPELAAVGHIEEEVTPDEEKAEEPGVEEKAEEPVNEEPVNEEPVFEEMPEEMPEELSEELPTEEPSF